MRRWDKQTFETPEEYRRFARWLETCPRPAPPVPLAERGDWLGRAESYDVERGPQTPQTAADQLARVAAAARRIVAAETDRMLRLVEDHPGEDLGLFKPRDLLALKALYSEMPQTETIEGDLDLSDLSQEEFDRLAALPRK